MRSATAAPSLCFAVVTACATTTATVFFSAFLDISAIRYHSEMAKAAAIGHHGKYASPPPCRGGGQKIRHCHLPWGRHGR